MDKSYTPRYVRIQQYILEQIKEGHLKPGNMLPTEVELVKMFGVSRITVTTALRELVKDGIIYRIQGKGSFVSTPKYDVDIFKIINTRMVQEEYGFGPSSNHTLIGAGIQETNATVADALALKKGERVIHIERLRSDNTLPLAYEDIFLPAEIYPDLLSKDIETMFLINLITNEYGITLGKNVMSAEPILSNKRISKLLGITVGSAILHWTMENYDLAGKPVGYSEVFFRGDRTRYTISFTG